MRAFLLIFIFLAGIALPPPALNALDPHKQVTQYMIDTWGLEEGLPQMSVETVTQTRDGYLWLGTREGLVRFDGLRFKVYDKRSVGELSHNYITVLLEDHRGALWIGTYGGGLTRMKDGKFTTYTTRNGLLGNIVRDLAQDPDRNLWIATQSGLNLLKNGRFQSYTTAQGLPGNRIESLCPGSGGDVWIGTRNGLSRLRDGQFTTFTTDRGLSHNRVSGIYLDRARNLWVGTEAGLNRRNPDNRTFTVYTVKDGLSNNCINAIHEDPEGNLWICTDGGGLNRWNPRDGTFRAITKKEGLTDNSISAIYQDREGSLWLGTFTGGLNRLSEGKFTPYTTWEGMSDDVAVSIYETIPGEFWFGTGNGLNRLKDGRFRRYGVKQGLSGNEIRAIHQDREGSLWIGAYGKGLNRLKDGRFTVYDQKDGLSNLLIRVIHEDRRGNLWIGTDGGVFKRREDGSFTPYGINRGLSNNNIRVIHEDRGGNLWIGTSGGGLNRLKDGKFSVYTTKDGLSNDFIRTLYEDSDRSLWIGTLGGGLNRFRDGIFKAVTTKDGLFDDLVQQVLEDDSGNLWMSCNKGIFSVARKELEEFFNRKRSRVNCISYDETDGMKSRECNGIGQPAGWKDRDGKLWFPTLKGVVMIDPNNIKPTPPPLVRIEEVVVDRETIRSPFISNVSNVSNDHELVLAPGKERFEIHYTGLSFKAPGRVRFRCMLEGYEEQWHDNGTGRVAHYTKLPPGRYTFRVMARTNDGVWSETGASLAFYLEPYYYQTTWFLFLCILAVLSIVVSLYRYRVLQLKSRADELRDQVDQRTRDLQEAKESAEKAQEMAESASRAKSEFLANMSHEIRTPMNAILGFTQIMENEIGDKRHKRFLTAISASGETLMRLINDILDLSRIEAGKMELHYEIIDPRTILNDIKQIFSAKVMEKGLEFQLEVAPALPQALKLDGLRIRQVLLNLVGNAVKFADTGFIRLSADINPVNVKSREEAAIDGSPRRSIEVVFSVRDSGIGIPPHQQQRIFEAFGQQEGQQTGKYGGTGLGLTITRRLVRMMGGSISVHSQEGMGSLFQVTLPNVTVPVVPGGTHAVIKPDVESIRFKKAVVLVVDDVPMNRGLLKEYLDQTPIRVLEAQNGKEALEMAVKHRPHVVLMDSKMPVMDGREATRRLKADKELKEIPVIMITASVLKDQRKKIQDCGSDGFMYKPVSKFDLIVELMRFIPYTIRPEREPVVKPGTGSGQTIRKSLSPGEREEFSRLLTHLRSHALTHRWQLLCETLIFDEVEDFAKEMTQLDKTYRSGILSRWGQRLFNDLQTFNLERIQESLTSFPHMIREIEMLAGEEK
ncbi:MAG: response regulator [bacterium]|nr:response regulator [bacterium]